jgi:hypothetical protein
MPSQTRKNCKKINFSIKPDEYKKMKPKKQVEWHLCYADKLEKRAKRITRRREKDWLRFQVKDQRKWAEEIQKKYKL